MKEIYQTIKDNEQKLSVNEYPGRGIVQGFSPDGSSAHQIYWLMGRSENSRNRVLHAENGSVRTAVFIEKPNEDHSLTIYNAMLQTPYDKNNKARSYESHIVSNGHQTDSIYDAINQAKSVFETESAFTFALNKWDYEPDKPNYTPRISSALDIVSSGMATPFVRNKFSIIKRSKDGEQSLRTFSSFSERIDKAGKIEAIARGIGRCIHTYAQNGDPVSSFDGKPYKVSLENTAKENAEKYAEILAGENFVSLVSKAIPLDGSSPTFHIINKNQK